MSPLQMSAQFAAYLWFIRQPENEGRSPEAAYEFARRHWERFLGAAHEGFGRLLMKVAQPRKKTRTLAVTAG